MTTLVHVVGVLGGHMFIAMMVLCRSILSQPQPRNKA